MWRKEQLSAPTVHFNPFDLNTEDRDQFVLERMPQVRRIAGGIKRQLPCHILLEDLVQAGVIGLMDALRKYDHARHVPFDTYAFFRVRGAIWDSLRETDWAPNTLRRKERKLEQVRLRLTGELGRSPADDELAKEAGVRLDKLQKDQQDLHSMKFVGQYLRCPQTLGEIDLCDSFPDRTEETPLSRCLQAESRNLLVRTLADLPEKERQVLTLCYFEGWKISAVANFIGLSESRVSQIRFAATARLRARIEPADLFSA
jgi:RNA polymerase sigma factor FliA